MAIYHCSLRVFSRERGHSAIAAAAYRSGQNLIDERTGTVHRYEKRRGVLSSQILLPSQASDHFQERLALWGAAEAAETRKNSRVAREIIIALPYELDSRQRESLARDMAAYLVENYRVAVDLAIHTPVDEDGHDPRNHHAHLLFTTRELTPDGLGAKTRILDDKITGPQQIEIIREVWETLANDALGRAGHSDVKIDRRTLESQGIERIPQIHEGKASTYADDLNNSSSQRGNEGEEEDDTEEEGDTETGKTDSNKSGSGEQGQLSPDIELREEIDPKRAENSKEEIKSQQVPEERDKSRSEFNAEIKALNEQRKEYPQTPLKLQIEAIEQEIDAIDRRVERLQTMLDKTSLPQKIQRLIGDVVVKAKEFLTVRNEEQIQRQLNEAEKFERQERQLARYGRTFRESIHSQIREMKDKLDTLHSREVEHKKYRTFVTMIEAEVMKIKVAPKNDMPTSPAKSALNSQPLPIVKSSSEPPVANISKGQAIVSTKAKIPDEYKPSPRTGKLKLLFEKANKEPSSMPKAGVEQAVPTRAAPSVTIDKMAIKQGRSTQGSEVRNTNVVSKSSNPQGYKIEANEQTKKMLSKIQAELQQRKAQEPKPTKAISPKSENEMGIKGKFSKPESPPVKAEEVIKKVRAEAEKTRQRVPPEYRAHPYTAEELRPKQQAASNPRAASPKSENAFEKLRKMWGRKASQTQSMKESTMQAEPRKTMSSAFKQAASKPENIDTSPSANAEQKPDIK